MKHSTQHTPSEKYIFQKPTFSHTSYQQRHETNSEHHSENHFSSHYPVQPPTWFDDCDK